MPNKETPSPLTRPMTAADWPAVEAGFAHSFLDCRAPAIWDWRFQQHLPAQSGWRGWITEMPNGDVAAFIGGSVHRGWLHAQDATFILARDNYSHPRWRSQAGGARHGLFARTEQAFHAACAADSSLCLGIGLDRRVKLDSLLGISTPYTRGQWWRAALAAIEPLGCSCLALPTHFSESTWNHLWRQRRTQLTMSLVRDQAFLAWRFDERQGQTYWRFGLWSVTSSTPLGYLVITPLEAGRAVLVDCVLPEQPEAIRDGMRQINAWLVERGIRQLETFLGRACPEQVYLPMLGFQQCTPPLPVMPAYRIYSGLAEDFEQHYAFTLADSDLY